MNDASQSGPRKGPADAPFAVGTRVSLRQYVLEGDQLRGRELGLGEVAVPLRVGGRLGVRIRAERGLASSEVEELELVEPHRVAVLTQGRVYLLSGIAGCARLVPSDRVEEAVARLLRESSAKSLPRGEFTEYLRIEGRLLDTAHHSLVGVMFSILRSMRDDPEAKPERLGVGHLLVDPEPGMPLRFVDGQGRVNTTSEVLSIEREGTDRIDVLTANRRYRLVRESEGG